MAHYLPQQENETPNTQGFRLSFTSREPCWLSPLKLVRWSQLRFCRLGYLLWGGLSNSSSPPRRCPQTLSVATRTAWGRWFADLEPTPPGQLARKSQRPPTTSPLRVTARLVCGRVGVAGRGSKVRGRDSFSLNLSCRRQP